MPLVLILYCTGIRFGEALRLRLHDVDTRAGALFVETFKGRARWVPFHRTLSRELDLYLIERRKYAPASSDTRFFVGINQRQLSAKTAHDTLRSLFADRPTTIRLASCLCCAAAHSVAPAGCRFARSPPLALGVHGTRGYCWHGNLSEPTPELLDLAADRLRRRYRRAPHAERAET